jgi:thiamine biosynthesis lipoprotein
VAGAQLDFNAIAEGYAIDAIAALLEQGGVQNYLIELGGEVLARGQRSKGEDWRVGIERPPDSAAAANQLQTVLRLKDSALGTSGIYRNKRIEGEKTIAHILNPTTGYPEVSSLLSASVLAGDATTADAYATAFMVMGLEEALKFVEGRAQLKAYFIAKDANGNLIEKRSSGFPPAEE